MPTENQLIKKLVKEHKALFKATNMDVAESIKGQWFFSRYNKEDGYYDCLIHFETAKELAEIMLGEIAADILVTIDREPEDKPSFPNFADDLEMEACYQPHIERLLEYLGR